MSTKVLSCVWKVGVLVLRIWWFEGFLRSVSTTLKLRLPTCVTRGSVPWSLVGAIKVRKVAVAQLTATLWLSQSDPYLRDRYCPFWDLCARVTHWNPISSIVPKISNNLTLYFRSSLVSVRCSNILNINRLNHLNSKQYTFSRMELMKLRIKSNIAKNEAIPWNSRHLGARSSFHFTLDRPWIRKILNSSHGIIRAAGVAEKIPNLCPPTRCNFISLIPPKGRHSLPLASRFTVSPRDTLGC